MKDTSKLLPIGSVVLLNNGTKKVMITGFYSVPANETEKVYDYCGCLFPEGVISSEQNLLFNHNQIMKVCYMGYTSDEEKEFKNKLGEIVNSENGGTADQTQTPNAEPVAPTPTVDTPTTTVEAPVAETPAVDAPAPEPTEPVAPTPAAEPVAQEVVSDSNVTEPNNEVVDVTQNN